MFEEKDCEPLLGKNSLPRRFRSPPQDPELHNLCQKLDECRVGGSPCCPYAHSEEELLEWKTLSKVEGLATQVIANLVDKKSISGAADREGSKADKSNGDATKQGKQDLASWQYRAPPRGVESYSLCKSPRDCRLGRQCSFAHSPEELQEWWDRFDARVANTATSLNEDGEGNGKDVAMTNDRSFANSILESLATSVDPLHKILLTSMTGVDCMINTPAKIKGAAKSSTISWVFNINSTIHGRFLTAVVLVENDNLFNLKCVKGGSSAAASTRSDNSKLDILFRSGSDELSTVWRNQSPPKDSESKCYEVEVTFQSDIYGTFQQSILFGFAFASSADQPPKQFLRRDLCVEVTKSAENLKTDFENSGDHSKVDEKNRDIGPECTVSKGAERWNGTNTAIVDMDPPLLTGRDFPDNDPLCQIYPSGFGMVKPDSIETGSFTLQSYRQRMHTLLALEEVAQLDIISSIEVDSKLELVFRYELNSAESQTVKYAAPNEVFGLLSMDSSLSEDTAAGRLILNYCSHLFVAVIDPGNDHQQGIVLRTAYVAKIEDASKKTLYLRLPIKIFQAEGSHRWHGGQTRGPGHAQNSHIAFKVKIQFHLSRLPICEMHSAVDCLGDLSVVCPNLEQAVKIPWNPMSQQLHQVDCVATTTPVKLNAKQLEAIVAITSSVPPGQSQQPPILILGPYGTGKTFTLAQAIRQLFIQCQPKGTSKKPAVDPRFPTVLVCTHSNSAADLYVQDHLHPLITRQDLPIKLLRVYYKNRRIQTVSPEVLKYCLVEKMVASGSQEPQNSQHQFSRISFRNPTKEDICGCNVVVTTLSSSRLLWDLGLQPGHFTHILVDEAAQALEAEAIMPLALLSSDAQAPAAHSTKVVFAGDPMQLTPEVFSRQAVAQGFNRSLLERLFDAYPEGHPCKIHLCENYRSHKAIVTLTSELFYSDKLIIASAKDAKNSLKAEAGPESKSGGEEASVLRPPWYPLTMFTARGEDQQGVDSTSFRNEAEVAEIVDRVSELLSNWPTHLWGPKDSAGSGSQQVGVVTPYHDQVQRIRAELRKRRLGGVSVERVLNVQGKQFRAIFLSIVRTRRTCLSAKEELAERASAVSPGSGSSNTANELDFGFLSNERLLNTAITRAQSLVAVVGDPVTMCSVGPCRKMWERYLEVCHQNRSFHGLTISALKAMLLNVELKRGFVLNPLASHYVPSQETLDSARALAARKALSAQSAALNGRAAGAPIYHGNQPQGLPAGVPTLRKVSPGRAPFGQGPLVHNNGYLNSGLAVFPRNSNFVAHPGLVGGPGRPSYPIYQRSFRHPMLPEPPLRHPVGVPPPPLPAYLPNNALIQQLQNQIGGPPGGAGEVFIHPLDLLPKDMDLLMFLQSQEMMEAWGNQLFISRGAEGFKQYYNLIFFLTCYPQVMEPLRQEIRERKKAALASMAFSTPPPPLQSSSSSNLGPVMGAAPGFLLPPVGTRGMPAPLNMPDHHHLKAGIGSPSAEVAQFNPAVGRALATTSQKPDISNRLLPFPRKIEGVAAASTLSRGAPQGNQNQQPSSPLSYADAVRRPPPSTTITSPKSSASRLITLGTTPGLQRPKDDTGVQEDPLERIRNLGTQALRGGRP